MVQCVGTPWLTISGGHWSEGNSHNGVPYYSVLPDNPAYPYLGASGYNMYAQRPKIPCLRPEKLEKKIPEIVISHWVELPDQAEVYGVPGGPGELVLRAVKEGMP